MPEERVSLSPPAVTPQDFAQPLVPAEMVPLPSKGLVYPVGHPLHGKEGVMIRAMTAREEDILTSRALLKSGKVITALLRSCIVDKDIDPETMLAGDRNAVLIGIRITGYGADYPIKWLCPSCTSEEKLDVNLAELPIKRFPEGAATLGQNEFSFVLPASKRLVTFRLLTGNDEENLLQMAQRLRKNNMPDELVTNRLKAQVVSIAGERDKQRLAGLILSMSARDSRSLRKYIDEVTPAVQLKAQGKCSVCSYDGEVEVPLGTDFFWPEA